MTEIARLKKKQREKLVEKKMTDSNEAACTPPKNNQLLFAVEKLIKIYCSKNGDEKESDA